MRYIVINRNGQNISYSLIPTIDEGRTVIGIIPKYEKSFIAAIKGGIEKTLIIIRLMFEFWYVI